MIYYREPEQKKQNKPSSLTTQRASTNKDNYGSEYEAFRNRPQPKVNIDILQMMKDSERENSAQLTSESPKSMNNQQNSELEKKVKDFHEEAIRFDTNDTRVKNTLAVVNTKNSIFSEVFPKGIKYAYKIQTNEKNNDKKVYCQIYDLKSGESKPGWLKNTQLEAVGSIDSESKAMIINENSIQDINTYITMLVHETQHAMDQNEDSAAMEIATESLTNDKIPKEHEFVQDIWKQIQTEIRAHYYAGFEEGNKEKDVIVQSLPGESGMIHFDFKLKLDPPLYNIVWAPLFTGNSRYLENWKNHFNKTVYYGGEKVKMAIAIAKYLQEIDTRGFNQYNSPSIHKLYKLTKDSDKSDSEFETKIKECLIKLNNDDYKFIKKSHTWKIRFKQKNINPLTEELEQIRANQEIEASESIDSQEEESEEGDQGEQHSQKALPEIILKPEGLLQVENHDDGGKRFIWENLLIDISLSNTVIDTIQVNNKSGNIRLVNYQKDIELITKENCYILKNVESNIEETIKEILSKKYTEDDELEEKPKTEIDFANRLAELSKQKENYVIKGS